MWEAKISIFCTRFPTSRSGQRAGDYRNLSSIQAGRSGFTSQEAKAASAGPEEQRAPTPSGTAGPGVATGPAEGRQWKRGLGAPVRGSAAGVTGEEEAGVTGEAAHGPRRSSGGRPGARYLRSGGGLLLLRASFGRPGPCRALALVFARLAPDSFSLSFPRLEPSSAVAPRWRRRDGSRERRAGQVSREARGRGRGH